MSPAGRTDFVVDWPLLAGVAADRDWVVYCW